MKLDRSVALVGGAALVALIAGSAVLVWPRGDDAFAACRKGVVAGGAGALGGPFTLVDETGATVTDAQVLDRPSLVYFGYSFCPDVCPLDASRNAEVEALMTERGTPVRTVFISIDPARDTPEKMAEYTGYFSETMLGLTGTEEQVASAAKAYRALYQKQGEGEDYLMGHSTFTYLSLPGHGVVEFFNRDEEAEPMADRVGCFLDNG
jgi:protein SCO1/2